MYAQCIHRKLALAATIVYSFARFSFVYFPQTPVSFYVFCALLCITLVAIKTAVVNIYVLLCNMKKHCILLMQCTSVYMCLMFPSTAHIIFVHSTGRLEFVLDIVFSVRKEQTFCEMDNVEDRDSLKLSAYSLILSARNFIVNIE